MTSKAPVNSATTSTLVCQRCRPRIDGGAGLFLDASTRQLLAAELHRGGTNGEADRATWLSHSDLLEPHPRCLNIWKGWIQTCIKKEKSSVFLRGIRRCGCWHRSYNTSRQLKAPCLNHEHSGKTEFQMHSLSALSTCFYCVWVWVCKREREKTGPNYPFHYIYSSLCSCL